MTAIWKLLYCGLQQTAHYDEQCRVRHCCQTLPNADQELNRHGADDFEASGMLGYAYNAVDIRLVRNLIVGAALIGLP